MSERMARLEADAAKYEELERNGWDLSPDHADILYLIRVKRFMEMLFEVPALAALDEGLEEDGRADTATTDS